MISTIKRTAVRVVIWAGRRGRRLLEWLGILKRRPVSIKPTGTISKICACAEGLHPVRSARYIGVRPIWVDEPPGGPDA